MFSRSGPTVRQIYSYRRRERHGRNCCCIDSNQILLNDKDQRGLRSGGCGGSKSAICGFLVIMSCSCCMVLGVTEKFKRGFLDVLECRCWSSRQNATNTLVVPAANADTRYIIATGRRTTAL